MFCDTVEIVYFWVNCSFKEAGYGEESKVLRRFRVVKV